MNRASFTHARFEWVNANGTDFLDTNLDYGQFRVNVDAAREYYGTHIHVHINYYGRCKPGGSTSGCNNSIGQCTNTNSGSNWGVCTGVAESIGDAHQFVGSSGMAWDTTLNQVQPQKAKVCAATGLGMDRNLYVHTSNAWMCGLIDRKWYWVILLGGVPWSDQGVRLMRSGIDPSKPGEPGGAMKLHLGYMGASTDGMDGYVLDIQGWVHISS